MALAGENFIQRIIGLAARRGSVEERRAYLALLQRWGSALPLLGLAPDDPCCRALRDALVSPETARELRARLAEFEADSGVTTLLWGDAAYPDRLTAIPDAPPILFVRGDPAALNRARPYVAMVGSRRADPAGCELTGMFARAVAEEGACVVSGLALGIDSAAHRGAIDSGELGATVAVIGSGLGNIYPERNQELAARIVDAGGAIVSQFDYYEKPLPQNFLDRNRIISGLSGATLVVQAPARSGALSTARHALEQGRELLVVPGDIADRRYEGSNRILRQGAAVITRLDDLLDEVFGESRSKRKKSPAKKSVADGEAPGLRRRIVKLLERHRAVAIDEVRRRCGDDAEFAVVLLELELDGIVRRLPGNELVLSRGGAG